MMHNCTRPDMTPMCSHCDEAAECHFSGGNPDAGIDINLYRKQQERIERLEKALEKLNKMAWGLNQGIAIDGDFTKMVERITDKTLNNEKGDSDG